MDKVWQYSVPHPYLYAPYVKMYTALRKSNENWRVFPNTVNLGYYSFFTQSVHLSSVEKNDIEELIKLFISKQEEITYEQYQLFRKTLSVLHHEYSHWVDNISTIWGTDLLIKVFEAFKLKADDQKGIDRSSEYFKIKELRDLTKRITYSDYYTTQYDVDNQYPWIVSYSMGKLFSKSGNVSEYPIFFSRFTTRIDKKLICRVPFSLSSILESSAMSQEFYIDNSALFLLPEDTKHVEIAQYKKEILSTIYNQKLCVYNVAAHHIANCTRTSDIAAAYRICGILGRLVLNFPSSLFNKINISNNHIDKITKGEHNKKWLEGYKVAFDYNDRGVLFFLIGSLLPKIENPAILTDKKIITMIMDVLSEINIKYEDLEGEALSEFDQNCIKLKKIDNPMAQYIANAGKTVFEQLNMFGEYPYEFHKYSPIPAILGDGSIFQPYGKPEKLNFDLFDYIYNAMDLEPHIREFEEACIF